MTISDPSYSVAMKNQSSDIEFQNGVIIGNNKNLFLCEGAHSVMAFLTQAKVPSERSFENFISNLDSRANAILNKKNTEFLHVIFPDKHSVCYDDFPLKNFSTLTKYYLERAGEFNKHILYLQDALVSLVDRPFLLTDTHLTVHGSAISAISIVERLIGENQKSHYDELIKYITPVFNFCGDLGSKVSPQQTETQMVSASPWINALHHNWYQGGGSNGQVLLCFNSSSMFDKRLLLFGDSFGQQVSYFLSYFFKEVVFLRTPHFHQDIFERNLPDYVITSNVERYFSHVNADVDCPSFFSYPSLNTAEYTPLASFREALSKVLSYGL